MNTDPKFYVYEHIRPDTGAVFYVGKGCGKRAVNFNNRTQWWSNIYNKVGSIQVEYPVKNVDEELSLLAEMEYIDVLRRRGVKLINQTDGGDSSAGYKHTEEAKAKMSQKLKEYFAANPNPLRGKRLSEEVKRKMSVASIGKTAGENHPFYNKKHSPESIEKMRLSSKNRGVVCVNTGIEYVSIKEAERQTGAHQFTIARVCNGLQAKTRGLKFEWSKK